MRGGGHGGESPHRGRARPAARSVQAGRPAFIGARPAGSRRVRIDGAECDGSAQRVEKGVLTLGRPFHRRSVGGFKRRKCLDGLGPLAGRRRDGRNGPGDPVHPSQAVTRSEGTGVTRGHSLPPPAKVRRPAALPLWGRARTDGGAWESRVSRRDPCARWLNALHRRRDGQPYHTPGRETARLCPIVTASPSRPSGSCRKCRPDAPRGGIRQRPAVRALGDAPTAALLLAVSDRSDTLRVSWSARHPCRIGALAVGPVPGLVPAGDQDRGRVGV
jgi:hypothetical protein